jgi:hypothetical protein
MPDSGADLQGRPALIPGIERTDRWRMGEYRRCPRLPHTNDSIWTNRQDDLVRRLE